MSGFFDISHEQAQKKAYIEQYVLNPKHTWKTRWLICLHKGGILSKELLMQQDMAVLKELCEAATHHETHLFKVIADQFVGLSPEILSKKVKGLSDKQNVCSFEGYTLQQVVNFLKTAQPSAIKATMYGITAAALQLGSDSKESGPKLMLDQLASLDSTQAADLTEACAAGRVEEFANFFNFGEALQQFIDGLKEAIASLFSRGEECVIKDCHDSAAPQSQPTLD